MELYKLLKKAIAESGLPISRISEMSGVSRQHIYKIVSGEKNISLKTLQKICNAINISPATLYEECESQPNTLIHIPVLSDISTNDNKIVVGQVEITPDLCKQGYFFALKIKDDGMSPTIQAGDTVVIKKQEFADSGDICVLANDNNELLVRELKKVSEGIWLLPHNLSNTFRPKFFSSKEVAEHKIEIVGIIIEVRRQIKQTRS